jgi:hypothetical protein
MTNEQKALAVADAHERLLAERPHWATLAELLDDPGAEERLGSIDRALGKLKEEAARLEAERSGVSAGAESREVLDSARYRDALDHTRKIEDEFDRDLARMGWYQQTSAEARREIEERALSGVGELYGEHAAEHCRRLLSPRPGEGAAAMSPLSTKVPISVPTLP